MVRGQQLQDICIDFIFKSSVFVLLGFYIMSQFHIAELARRGTVKMVTGSAPHHVAYQIGPAFNFRMNTR